ncbi:MAG: peptide-methionine (R)-S-oxide reductase MsrB [Gammaproteobacteria bacterium]
MGKRVEKTDEQWRAVLPDAVFRICREGKTEHPFSGEYCDHKAEGQYVCAACAAPLFVSSAKYDSRSGWPSFWSPVAQDAVLVRKDLSHGMERAEVLCACCDAHLGHRFDDGPQPTGLRYSINSLALHFLPSLS